MLFFTVQWKGCEVGFGLKLCILKWEEMGCGWYAVFDIGMVVVNGRFCVE